MLHRAVACTVAPWGHPDDQEVHIFFEAPSHCAIEALANILAHAWRVPAEAVLVYNIAGEHELLSWGEDGTGDLRLLEIGSDSTKPIYARPDRTLMFVTPLTLRRLVAAQQLVRAIA